VTFEFEQVLVNGDNDPSNNTFLICFEAVVLNEAGNQASPPPLTNSATLTVEGEDFNDSEDVNLVEPVLTIAKTADDVNPIVGETVTFTITVQNTNVANGADAFDVVILDDVPLPDFTLDLGSITWSDTSGTETDASSGNQVRIEIDELPIGETIQIEFEAVYNGPTDPITNTASVTWTSLPGGDANERDGSDGPGGALDDYADSDELGLDDERTVDKTLDTAIDITSNETLPDVTIGDIITYQIVLTIPAGSSDLYTIIDTLDTGLPAPDSGLAFVAVESFVLSDTDTDGAGQGDTGIYFSGGGSTTPVITNDGAIVTFNLGTVNNTSSTAQTITIRYTAAVLDVLINSNGGGVNPATQLSNEVVVTWETPAGGGDSQSDAAAPVTVNEPLLTMDKTVDPLIAAPGATITYTLQVEHVAESDGDAFDLVLTDVLPEGLVYAGGTPAVNTVSGPAPTAAFDAPTRTLTLTWAAFPFGSVSVMEIEAQLGPTLGRGSTIVNEASLEWTSLPGDFSAPQSAFNSFSTERRYDPANPADVYIVESEAVLTIPILPRTGFAPGEVTLLPPQPADMRYADLGDFWIEIPRLDEQLAIVGVPFDSRGWNLTWLGAQAGYLEGTAYPTHAGTSGITAHAYLPDGTAGPFVNLNRLRYGDQVIVHLGAQDYVFEVRENRRIAPNDLSVLRHEEYPWLTLITCQDYSEALDDYRYRVAVRAVLVKIETPAGR
jgi:LPXTG-site transpeptidase (sortase) family protein